MNEFSVHNIFSESTEVSIREGWGGREIDFFPPHIFFSMYASGQHEEAFFEMIQWYRERFLNQKLCIVPKHKGGMMGGSLYRLIAKIHESKDINLNLDLSNGDLQLIDEGIKAMVERRFGLFLSIQKHGYVNCGDYIHFKKGKKGVVIIDGHHRVAALSVCGYGAVIGSTHSNLVLRIIRKASFVPASEIAAWQ